MFPSLTSLLSRPDCVVDLGNRNTLIWTDASDDVITAPTAIAYKTDRHFKSSTIAVGQAALDFEGRTQSTIEIVHPLTDGMVTHVDAASQFLEKLLQEKLGSHHRTFDRVLISSPVTASSIEKRAFAEVATKLGARKVYAVAEPLAAAIGAGLDVLAPHGRCVVDIGDGIIESVVISLGQIVSAHSIRLKERSFEAQLISHLHESCRFSISHHQAEQVKIALSQNTPPHSVTLHGFCWKRRLPVSQQFLSNDFLFIKDHFANDVVSCVLESLAAVPPDLHADLCADGIILTGGNSIDPFLSTALEQKLHMRVQRVDDPLLTVTNGNRMALQDRRFASLLERYS